MVLAAAVHAGVAPLVAWLLQELPAGGGGARCDVAAALEQEDLLHEAASRGDVEVLAALLAAAGGGALARTDGRGLGRTPLHSSVIHRQAAAAELLIQAAVRQQGGGAAAAAAGGDGDTAEEAAPGAAAAPACCLDAADSQGLTPLAWAAMTGSMRVLRVLLAAGASREAAAADGMTPLHLAAKAGHGSVVQALLEAGSSVTGGWGEGAAAVVETGALLSCLVCAQPSTVAPSPHAAVFNPACFCPPPPPPPPPRPAALDAHGCLPLHYIALRGDLALFVLLFSPSAPTLAAAPAAGAALLTAAIRGGSSEMVGIVLLTGATSPQVRRFWAALACARRGCCAL